MSRESSITARKTGMAFLLATGICLLSVGDVPAGKKKRATPNPSPVGAANGVAHRVAALEEGLAETQAALAETQDVLLTVMDRIVALEDAVVALDARVAALEAAAVEPEPEPAP